jgi:hypothetical protein
VGAGHFGANTDRVENTVEPAPDLATMKIV